MKRVLRFFTAALPLGAPFSETGAAENTAEAMRLLKTNCISCHNGEKKKGGLVATSREALLKGGDNGAELDRMGARRMSPKGSTRASCNSVSIAPRGMAALAGEMR